MRDDDVGAKLHPGTAEADEQAALENAARREFLKRLRRTAVFVAPVVSAVALTPTKAWAS